MIKKRKFPKIFFGWWTVIAGGVLSLWLAGYQTYGISALFKPIASELGFSRTAASVPGGMARLEGGFEGPIAGWATDKYGPRTVILLGVLLSGLSLILMYYINSLWAFYLVWGVLLGTAHNLTTAIPVDTAITNWFVKKRGTALGIKMVFSGFSGVLVLPLIAFLINQEGWRMTCVIGGVVALVVFLPVVWFCFKPHRPEYYGLLPDGATVKEEITDTDQTIEQGVKYATEVEEVEFTLRQAMKTRVYWLLMLGNAVHGLVFSAVNVHLIPYLTDVGIDPIKAAGMMAIMVFASLPTRFIAGFFCDRVSKNQIRFVVAGGYFLQTLGFAIFVLINPQTMFTIYAWLILYGIGHGAGFIFSALVGRYYGRKAFGSIQGTRMMFMAVPGMIAPIYAGWIYDTTGSYITSFVTFAITLAVSTILIAISKPPKPPAEVTDIRKIV
ncbi:MFS transporter [Chloroflexota bacterium]